MNDIKTEQDVEDINSRQSTKTGFLAVVENVFRKFQTLGFLVFIFPIILICVLCLAIALTPAMALIQSTYY